MKVANLCMLSHHENKEIYCLASYSTLSLVAIMASVSFLTSTFNVHKYCTLLCICNSRT